ncbi:CDGSH iron-sulfur domain-containing protein 3 mitochondrial [Clonorchis sinensis]|uniref:CDGSH iron-sulfur domain-containing protein 3 mitochondrial n=1 Tax=Clonorchis sinensis TaxID=79923 RepID=G7YLG9_CLOSI|nr:CDGSH iron-sulfur domain-containing protein 3 mitochondrial [Clonorchis sinensis]
MSFKYFTSRRLSYAAHSRPFYPAVAEYGPKRLDKLIPGKVYLWCSCGLSKSQPWCDGSHKPTHFRPLRWVVPATKPDSVQASSHSICQCKYTSTPPLCDSTHNQLHQEVADRRAHCSCSHSGSAPQYILPDGQRTFCDRCGNVTPNVQS